MKIKDAEKITHSLSKPGKMPGYAYSTPAHECKQGLSFERLMAQSVLIVMHMSAAGIDFKMLKMHNTKDWRPSSTHYGPGPWLFK